MKEITRVHIAKQAYDIEVAAKRDLDKYLQKLELYAGDDEILADIEIRITELLIELGVEKGGVITSTEVARVRERLGEPEEFASDDQALVDNVSAERSVKRLYRNMDGALLGGVLNGIATYLKIDVVWARLVFIVLLIVSFGTASLVYIIFWIVVPPARTIAEKLQLEGKPVTLSVMRERVADGETSPSKTAQLIKKFLYIVMGVMAFIVALGALLIVARVVVGVMLGGMEPIFGHYGASEYDWMVWFALGLFILSGLLLAILSTIVSVALFKQQFTKRMGIAIVVIIISGIVASSGGVAMAIGYSQLISDVAQKSLKTYKMALPELTNIKSVVSIAHSASGQERGAFDQMAIRYIVTTGAPRFELQTQYEQNKPDIFVDGETARISLKAVGQQIYRFGHTQPQLTIYGPALESVDVQQGDFQYTSPDQQTQNSLMIRGEGGNSVVLYGAYDTVSVSGGNIVDLSMSAVRSLTVSTGKNLSHVRAGVVYDLSVISPEVCPVPDFVDDPQWTLSVRGVSSGQMSFNGVVGPLKQYDTPCISIVIGADEVYTDDY